MSRSCARGSPAGSRSWPAGRGPGWPAERLHVDPAGLPDPVLPPVLHDPRRLVIADPAQRRAKDPQRQEKARDDDQELDHDAKAPPPGGWAQPTGRGGTSAIVV